MLSLPHQLQVQVIKKNEKKKQYQVNKKKKIKRKKHFCLNIAGLLDHSWKKLNFDGHFEVSYRELFDQQAFL